MKVINVLFSSIHDFFFFSIKRTLFDLSLIKLLARYPFSIHSSKAHMPWLVDAIQVHQANHISHIKYKYSINNKGHNYIEIKKNVCKKIIFTIINNIILLSLKVMFSFFHSSEISHGFFYILFMLYNINFHFVKSSLGLA